MAKPSVPIVRQVDAYAWPLPAIVTVYWSLVDLNACLDTIESDSPPPGYNYRSAERQQNFRSMFASAANWQNSKHPHHASRFYPYAQSLLGYPSIY